MFAMYFGNVLSNYILTQVFLTFLKICIKGKIHIFKYLNIEACKIAPDLPDYDRRPMGFGSW